VYNSLRQLCTEWQWMASNGDVFANYCQVTINKNPSRNQLCDDFNGDEKGGSAM
jgi:hypothetical protein